MPRVAHNFRFFAGWLGELDGGGLEISGHREQVSWAPAGVTAVITPWNAPLMLATWRIAPALAAGNTVVAKPPEWAPLTASLLADITREAGLPDGVFNVVQGLGEEAGAPLAAHPDRRGRVHRRGRDRPPGRRGRGRAADPVSLELGGKSPLLVFADADLDLAVGHAVGQYDNAGQVCLAGTRLLVEEPVAEEFIAASPARRRPGAGRPAGRGHRHRPARHPRAPRAGRRLRPARGRGGRAPAARRRGQPGPRRAVYQPTLLAGAEPGTEILTEEVFGPVLTLQTFTGEDEAVALANGTRYGLAATLVTGDPGRAERVAARLRAGTVWVNCFFVRDLRAPFGGTGHSGIGREGGTWSFDFYGDVKNTVFAGQGRRPVKPQAPGRHAASAASRRRGPASPRRQTARLRHDQAKCQTARLRRDAPRGRQRNEAAWVRWSARACSPTSRRSCSRTSSGRSSTTARTSRWSPGWSGCVRGLRDARLRHRRGPRFTLGHDRGVRRHRPQRAGLFTSEELPRGMCRRPYDFPGDPEFAPDRRAGGPARYLDHRDRRPLPADLLRDHQPLGLPRPRSAGKRWISMGICQTGDTEDFLRLVGPSATRSQSDRRAAHRVRRPVAHVLAAAQLRDHEAAASSTSSPPRPRRRRRADRLVRPGDHARVLDTMPEFYRFKPEARFGHYLMMIGALGEGADAPGRQYGEYENSVGTGQVHLWFDRPRGGFVPEAKWNRGRSCQRAGCLRSRPIEAADGEYRRILLTGRRQVAARARLVAGDGRGVGVEGAVHLPPVVPTQDHAVHLNYRSRVDEL